MNPHLRLLILEDRPTDAELMLRELRRAGYEPQWLRVETEAAFLTQLDQDWEIILADYHLPQFTGLRALELLRASGRDLPFILISGAIGEDKAVAAMKAGAHDYVMKDHLARLGPAVERELREAAGRAERRRLEAEREELLIELQAALAQVKRLTGWLPICSGCKKIRDGQGAWHPVESYVQKHSEAVFTHGLCPNCIQTYFPEADPATVPTDSPPQPRNLGA